MNRLKLGLVWIGATALAATASPALAMDGAAEVETAAASLAPNSFVWSEDPSAAPLNVVVSIADQRAYVYRGTMLVAASSVSTGKDGKETPVGTYSILQKEPMHRSNLYNAAPMPFMQRLTWDGIAIHAGNNPGFPDSHGCIRVPAGFAKKLFAATRVGTTVTVTDESIEGRSQPSSLLPDDMMDDSVTYTKAETVQANAEQIASATVR